MNQPNYHNIPSPFPPEYASAWGEDQSGLWFDLSINKIVQCFRWIPAGNFLMIYPEREPWKKETYHTVLLDQGFWLADTACTQALWTLIMGGNPAKFSEDKQNPVENVSWLHTQEFLDKLNRIIPELKGQLPSESQWEYACRAGTTTSFSFGEIITTNQVNYNGNLSYTKGEYREKTTTVKALPANQWGLYQMHGNIYEWCRDKWSNTLGESPITGSIQPSDNIDNRSSIDYVLCGGSWFHHRKNCRSSSRKRSIAGYRSDHIGFRLSLGH